MQNALEKLPGWLLMTIGLIMVALLGWIDYLTGDYSILIFYALPVALEAWFVGRRAALVTCAAAATARYTSDYINYSSAGVKYWNSLQDMVFLLIIGLLIAAVKKLIVDDQEKLDR